MYNSVISVTSRVLVTQVHFDILILLRFKVALLTEDARLYTALVFTTTRTVSAKVECSVKVTASKSN